VSNSTRLSADADSLVFISLGILVIIRFFMSTEKEIELQDKKVQYTLRLSTRAKRMRLAIYHNGAFVVTAPRLASFGVIENFIFRKAEWVLRKLKNTRRVPEKIFYKSTKKEYATYKEKARALAHDRMRHFNTIYNFSWERVAIRNQKSRWGSCSQKGNINFNYKIALLPAHLADYVIVHEMCHLKEFNHSQKFWDLVARVFPNHTELRKELKKISLQGY
jgi:predicted metal-dependent hydrolase